MSLHIVFRKIPEGWSGTYENLDEQNKLIEINPRRGEKRTLQAPYHELTHWMLERYKDRIEWRKGWPKKLKQEEKEDIICYEVDEEVWGAISKYLKKGKR